VGRSPAGGWGGLLGGHPRVSFENNITSLRNGRAAQRNETNAELGDATKKTRAPEACGRATHGDADAAIRRGWWGRVTSSGGE